MRKLPVTMLAAFALLSVLSRSGLAEFGKRQELTIRAVQRALEQRDLADHFAILRRKILEHARTRLEGDAQVSTDGASYVSIIPYVAADANTRTNLGLNNFSQNSLTHGASPNTRVEIGLFDPQAVLVGQRNIHGRDRTNFCNWITSFHGLVAILPPGGCSSILTNH